jgi:hypothetical protein
MNIEEFKTSTKQDAPPAELPRVLAALWWDAKGNFERAHELADDETDGRESAWVHAYLHRKHGSPTNLPRRQILKTSGARSLVRSSNINQGSSVASQLLPPRQGGMQGQQAVRL